MATPDPVDLVPVGQALRPVKKAPPGIKRSLYAAGTTYPIIDQGQNRIAGFTDDANSVLPAADYIVFGDHSRIWKRIDFAFAPGADGTRIFQAAPGFDPRFLFYAVSALQIPSRGYNRHWTVVKDLLVPKPALARQQQISRNLAQMESLRESLQSELDARLTQFDYYRHALVDEAPFDVSMPIDQLGSVFGGLTGKTKQDFADGNSCFLTYMDVFTSPVAPLEPTGTVKVGVGEKQKELHLGDIVFTASSERADEVGMSSVLRHEPTDPLFLNSFCFALRPSETVPLLPEYATHLFRSRGMRDRIVRCANGVTRFNISKRAFKAINVDLPSLADQKVIASQLDTMQALIRSLASEGEARREQFEHYRDRILLFSEGGTPS